MTGKHNPAPNHDDRRRLVRDPSLARIDQAVRARVEEAISTAGVPGVLLAVAAGDRPPEVLCVGADAEGRPLERAEERRLFEQLTQRNSSTTGATVSTPPSSGSRSTRASAR